MERGTWNEERLHCTRNSVFGSTFDAALAGHSVAPAATTSITTAADTSTIGSDGVVAKSSDGACNEATQEVCGATCRNYFGEGGPGYTEECDGYIYSQSSGYSCQATLPCEPLNETFFLCTCAWDEAR